MGFFKKLLHKGIIIRLVIVIVLSSVTGYFGAQFYINKFMKTVQAVTESEEDVRDDAEKIYSQALGKTPADLTPTQNFVIAEYLLNQQTSVKKTTTGSVTAAGVTQGLYAEKMLVDGEYYAMKISSGLVPLATRTYYVSGSDNIDLYLGSDIKSDTATFGSSPDKQMTPDEFRELMGSKVTYFISYVVSSNSVEEEESLGLNEAGNYEFALKLDTYFSCMNYSHEIKYTSDSPKLPEFTSVKIVFEIDKDWNLKRIDYDESYNVSVKQLGSMFVGTTGKITDRFEVGGDYTIPRS